MRAIGPALSLLLVSLVWTPVPVAAEPFTTTIEQITFGPRHHFFGYFGHARTMPLERERTVHRGAPDRRSRIGCRAPGEAAEIVLLDARDGYTPRVVDRTRAWNFQQGTMLYWNPRGRRDTVLLQRPRPRDERGLLRPVRHRQRCRRANGSRSTGSATSRSATVAWPSAADGSSASITAASTGCGR